MPGAWLQAPAKTSGTARLVLHHGVDAGAHRTVPLHALAHRVQIGGPFEAAQRRIMHQQLTVDAEHVQETDMGLADRVALLRGQLVGREHKLGIGDKAPPQLGITVELIEQLLHVIEAHARLASGPIRQSNRSAFALHAPKSGANRRRRFWRASWIERRGAPFSVHSGRWRGSCSRLSAPKARSKICCEISSSSNTTQRMPIRRRSTVSRMPVFAPSSPPSARITCATSKSSAG